MKLIREDGTEYLTINGIKYGPRDKAPNGVSCAALVADWSLDPKRTWDELSLAHRFLAQWEDGPQTPRSRLFILQRRGGRAKSEKKTAACRRNAQLRK